MKDKKQEGSMKNLWFIFVIANAIMASILVEKHCFGMATFNFTVFLYLLTFKKDFID